MNTKRNLWRKKEDRCRVCKWRHMELLSTRRAWHTTCQWSDPSQHVTSSWHASSYWSIRSNTALWLVSLRVPGILSITASLVIASRGRIKTLISKFDLVIERSLTAKVDSRCFHLEKVALRKRERLTAVFCPSSKYWGVVPFTRGRVLLSSESLDVRFIVNHPATIKLFGQTFLAPGRQSKYLTWDVLQLVRTQRYGGELKPQCLFRRSLLNLFCSSLSLHLRRTQSQTLVRQTKENT